VIEVIHNTILSFIGVPVRSTAALAAPAKPRRLYCSAVVEPPEKSLFNFLKNLGGGNLKK